MLGRVWCRKEPEFSEWRERITPVMTLRTGEEWDSMCKWISGPWTGAWIVHVIPRGKDVGADASTWVVVEKSMNGLLWLISNAGVFSTPPVNAGVPQGSFIDLLLLHSFAKMILLSPMTSNTLLISKYIYPLLTSQTTDSYPASHLVSMLRWWTPILDFMYLQVSSWLLISLPKSAAHPSPCMHDTMHLLEHNLSQNVDISPNDSVFLIIPHSHYK